MRFATLTSFSRKDHFSKLVSFLLLDDSSYFQINDLVITVCAHAFYNLCYFRHAPERNHGNRMLFSFWKT